MRSNIFRQSALEELSSPEQLDTLMQVTRPRGWLALLTLVAVLFIALVWSFLGRIPNTVAGGGMLVGSGGVNRVVSSATGQLYDLTVRIGESVNAGAVIGHVRPIDPAYQPVAISTPFAGRVIETAVVPGDFVNRGDAILTLGPIDDDLSAILYLPFSEGRRVAPGMEVQISPSTVAKEEYGVMKGIVRSVGEFPATSDRMMRMLGDPRAVEQLAAVGLPLEVHVDLIPDAATPSGYRWSSPQGPPVRLHNGTLVQATVIVNQERPIQLLLGKIGF